MAANITLTSPAISSDGKTFTATLSGGTEPFAITNANGLIVAARSLRRLITGQSVSGSVLTLTFGFPIGSGDTVVISTNSGATSTLTDTDGDTLQTQTNLSVTNNSSVTVTGFNSNNASARLFGGFTTTVSGGRNLYSPQPPGSGMAIGFTGTDVALIVQSSSAFAVGLDGSETTATPSVTNTIVVLPIVTAASEATHQLYIKGGQYWDAGTGTTSQGSILVAGASPAVSAPTDNYGARYFTDETPFTTYAEYNPAPLFSTSTTTASHVYKQLQPGQGIRFRSDSSFIGIFGFRSTSAGRTYVVYQDGVEISSTAIPTTPNSTYHPHILATGLSGTHDYEIVCVTPITYRTSGTWYEGHLMLDNTGIVSTSFSNRFVEAYYGDSITGMTSGSPAYTELRPSDMWIAARAANHVVAINGVGGGKVHTTGRDSTANIPTNCDRVHVRYGTNDLPDIGSSPGDTNFQTSYGTMIDNIRTRIGAGKPIYCYQPFPRTSGTNRSIAATLIQAAISGKSDVLYIPTDNWTPTTTTYLHDGIHPTAAGYAKLGNRQIPIHVDESIAITGPSTGAAGAASSTFTVTMSGGATFTGDQVVTLTASEGTITATASGGSISGNGTSAVEVTAADGQTSFTFTYTPGTAGAKTITPTVTEAGWTMPAATNYTASAAGGGSAIVFFQ